MRSQVDQLQAEVQRLEDIVAERENTISAQDNQLSMLKRQVEDLIPKADQGQRYKDDLDEAQHTIERLRKSQNMAEKFRKKIESMGDIERQVKTLERQNAKLTQDLRTSEENSKLVPGLKRTIEQYKQTSAKMDADLTAVLNQRTMLETEIRLSKAKLAGAESQKSQDQEHIRALEAKIQELESGVLSKDSDEASGDLAAELDYTKMELKLQQTRLEDELAFAGAGASSEEVVRLQNLLDDSTRAKERLELDLLDLSRDKLVLESQLDELLSGTLSDSSNAMLHLRKSLTEAQIAIKELQNRESTLLSDLAEGNSKIQDLNRDLSLVDADKLTALSELKASASEDLVSLRGRFADLETKLADTTVDRDSKQSLLNKCLLEKDDLQQKLMAQKDTLLEKEQALADLKTTIAALQGRGEGSDAALEKRVKDLQTKLEERREKMVKTREHIKKQNKVILELKEELERTKREGADERLEVAEMRAEDVKVSPTKEVHHHHYYVQNPAVIAAADTTPTPPLSATSPIFSSPASTPTPHYALPIIREPVPPPTQLLITGAPSSRSASRASSRASSSRATASRSASRAPSRSSRAPPAQPIFTPTIPLASAPCAPTVASKAKEKPRKSPKPEKPSRLSPLSASIHAPSTPSRTRISMRRSSPHLHTLGEAADYFSNPINRSSVVSTPGTSTGTMSPPASPLRRLETPRSAHAQIHWLQKQRRSDAPGPSLREQFRGDWVKLGTTPRAGGASVRARFESPVRRNTAQ